MQFCSAYSISPLPAQENKLCSFVAYLAKSGISYQTIECYLSAVKHMQVERGMGELQFTSMPVLEHVLRGVKKEHAKKAKPTLTRLPITSTILLQIRAVWERDAKDFDKIMLWAACCTCYFGFLRSGEVCVPSAKEYDPSAHLSMNDIAVDSHEKPSVISVNIKASKSDPYRQGVTIFLGATDQPLCPVKALLAYIAVRGQTAGPLFQFKDKQPLTREKLVVNLRAALTEAGLNPKDYAGHSFRIGAATTAHIKGVEDSTIMTLGRWKSEAYRRYVRIPKEHLAKISASIAHPLDTSNRLVFQPMRE